MNVGSLPEQRVVSERAGQDSAASTPMPAWFLDVEQLATTPTALNTNAVAGAAARTQEETKERERFTKRQRKYSFGWTTCFYACASPTSQPLWLQPFC